MLLNRSLRSLLVFHRLQLGSHIGFLLLQQCLTLFRFTHSVRLGKYSNARVRMLDPFHVLPSIHN